MRQTMLLLSLLLYTVSALPSHPQVRDASASFVAFPFTRHLSSTPALHKRQFFSSSLAPLNAASYFIDVAIGTPPQSLSLVLDTGSSDIWAYSPSASDTYYDPTQSSTAEERLDIGPFNITYVTPDSNVLGDYYADVLTTGGVSATVVLAVATEAGSGAPPGGIMGISFSAGEASVRQSDIQYDGYIDSLYKQGLINVRGYSIYFNEQSSTDKAPGTIIFGGYDNSKWLDELIFFPLVEPSPEGVWELDIGGPTIECTVNGVTSPLPNNQQYTVLLDTGTTYSRLPESQFSVVVTALDATLADADSNIYTVSCDYATASGGLAYAFAGPNGQTTISVPWAQMIIFDDSLPSGTCVLGLVSSPDNMGFYIFGDTFLRSAYVLYDYDNLQVGLAQASYDDSCDDCVSALVPGS